MSTNAARAGFEGRHRNAAAIVVLIAISVVLLSVALSRAATRPLSTQLVSGYDQSRTHAVHPQVLSGAQAYDGSQFGGHGIPGRWQPPARAVLLGSSPVVAAEAGTEATAGGDGLAGTRVYRVWGRDPANPDLAPRQSGPWGSSWTRVNPATVTKFRDVAGLPNDANLGRFVSEGVLRDPTGVGVTQATQIGQNLGGLDELVIPNPEAQIDLLGVFGVNPEF